MNNTNQEIDSQASTDEQTTAKSIPAKKKNDQPIKTAPRVRDGNEKSRAEKKGGSMNEYIVLAVLEKLAGNSGKKAINLP